ncbi:MAG: hypothetical protein E7316_09810 [Clostridiales bacterium]|nr:hypothetical protein [Clostridiales bacterium]
MKRKIFCYFLFLCVMLTSTASANSWGAPGDTIDLFNGTDYNDYSVVAEDYSHKRDAVHFVVNTRYHQQLLIAEKAGKEWAVVQASTKAVWQPDDPQADDTWPETRQDDKGFTLLYENENYRFENSELTQAKCGTMTYTLREDGDYEVSDGSSTTLWHVPHGLFISNFNIRLLPRRMEEVARMNQFYDLTADMFTPVPMEASQGKPAVYSAPTEDSWRAKQGKAYVSLRDPDGLYRFGIVEKGWELIQYKVSMRTSRVGYIQSINAQPDPAFALGWHMIPVVAAADTYFTDDPDVSQFQQGFIPAGKTMLLLGRWDDFYAYVTFVHEGMLTRGFIPLRDLETDEYSPQLAGGQLQGTYTCLRGGNPLSDSVTFHYDHTFTQQDGSTGTWEISSGDPFFLTMNYSKDSSETMELHLYSNGFSLFDNGTGAGDYIQQ